MTSLDSLHDMVEDLAQTLQRSVAIDDPGLRLLASSTHFEDVDEARITSLVGRKVTGPLREHIMRLGLQHWHEVTSVEAVPELGCTHPRVCFPLRSRYELLGFMWIMTPTPLSSAEQALAEEYATRLQRLLAARAQSLFDADIETESLVVTLLTGSAHESRGAAFELQELGLFHRADRFATLLVSGIAGQEDSRYGERPLALVRRAVSLASSGFGKHGTAYAAIAGEFALITLCGSERRNERTEDLAALILAETQRLEPALAKQLVIGIGDATEKLECATHSYQQARVAAQIARVRNLHLAKWRDRPSDALVHAVAAEEIDSHMLPPVVRETLGRQNDSTIELIECYLDLAGNVIAVAERLHLHRTTVYYRLNRFQETTGLDLNDGSVRLMLHLFLRARKLFPERFGNEAPGEQ